MPQPVISRTDADPELLHQINYSYAPSRVLSTGVQLSVFTHIADGKTSAKEIARAAKASLRGMTMLLDALVACRLLVKQASEYGLTAVSEKFLVRDSPEYAGAIMEQDSVWDAWKDLPKSVRTGKPYRSVRSARKAGKFFPDLVRSLHIINGPPAREAARVLGIGGARRGLRVIDVACGSGVWGIAVAEADATAQVTAQDFPAMLDLTRTYLRRHGVAQQFDFLPGDLNKVDYGKKTYDLAFLGNIVHGEGEKNSRRLFKRMHRALRPGGILVIAEMVPNDDRTGPAFPLYFALNMLLNTENGGTYTLAEYRKWLADAGFDRVETADVHSHSPIIIAYKKYKRAARCLVWIE